MKTKLIKFMLPIRMGLILSVILLFGLVMCDLPTDEGGGGGDDGDTGCIPTNCPSNSPWLGCGLCYTSSDACHEGPTTGSGDDCTLCRMCPT